MTFCKGKSVRAHLDRRAVGRATGIMLAMTVGAAPAAGQTPLPLATLLDCRSITDGAERLSCFDRSAKTLSAAVADRDLIVTDRQQRAALAKQDFGRPAGAASGSRADVRAPGRPELPARIDATIAKASRLPTGRWLIVLDNGARWQQADDRILARDPRAGMTISVTRAALGSYLGKVDGQVGIRLRRVD